MEAHSAVPRPSGGLSLPRSRRLLAPLSDDRLVEQVRRGNDAAFEVIYDRHSRGILSFCRHMLASVEEAEDALQHTFIQAYDSIRRSGRELKLKAWLYTIARNRCLSVLRARREHAAELDDVPTAGLADEVQQRSDVRDMLVDIRDLPEDQRAALVLSELGDLSHAEIATVVGCEASKVKSLVFQARSSLMESRKAREIPCHEIREQLATATGGVLRRGPLRRHVKHCQGCSQFRNEVQRQRRMMAAALPVVPTLALKHSALAAVGIGTGGASAAGGAAAGGGIASLVGTSGAGKAIAVLAVAGATVGSGVAVTEQIVSNPATQDSAQPALPSAPANPGDPAVEHAAAAQGRAGGGAAGSRNRSGHAIGPAAGRRGSHGNANHGRDTHSGGRFENGHHNSHAAPPAGGSMGLGNTDHSPGVNGNGDPLPSPSNGGDGGGNSGARSGGDQGSGSASDTGTGSSDSHGNQGTSPGQSGIRSGAAAEPSQTQGNRPEAPPGKVVGAVVDDAVSRGNAAATPNARSIK